MSLKADLAGWFLSCVIMKAKKSAEIAGTRISAELIGEFSDGGSGFVKLYETGSTVDPLFPNAFGGKYIERWIDSNLCGVTDTVSFRSHGVTQDITARRNLVFSNGIRDEDPNVPGGDFGDFGTALSYLDYYDSSGVNQASANLTVRGETVLSGSTDVENDIRRLVLNAPEGSASIVIEDESAEIIGFPISLRSHTDVPGVGKYMVERNADGSIKQIDQYILSTAVAGGARTVPLPLALPDSDELKVNVQCTGISPLAAGGIAAADYIGGTLTTTSVDIHVFDGAGFGIDSAFIHLTWKP